MEAALGGVYRGSGANMLLPFVQIALVPSIEGHNPLKLRCLSFIVRLHLSSEQRNEQICFNS